MKRINKIWGIVAGTMVAAGVILVILALLMGATWQDASVGLFWRHNGQGGESHTLPGILPSASPARETTLKEDYTGIHSLEFDLEAAEVTITQGEKFSIEVSGSGTKFESKVKEGVWEIESKGVANVTDRYYLVKITLPKDFEAQGLDIGIGMGSLTAQQLRSKKAELSCGMGELSIGTLYTGRAEIDCGMGELAVKELHSRGTEISCGMGNATIGGELLGKTILDGSMGSLKLNLMGKAEDYGYITDLGMGSVTIDGQTVAGVAGEKRVAMERSNTLDITCGMGEVVVRFEQ